MSALKKMHFAMLCVGMCGLAAAAPTSTLLPGETPIPDTASLMVDTSTPPRGIAPVGTHDQAPEFTPIAPAGTYDPAPEFTPIAPATVPEFTPIAPAETYDPAPEFTPIAP